MGTRTPFPTRDMVLDEGMEDGCLHFKSPDENRTLELLPLIKIMPSPITEKNACYFYNRLQNEGLRFISYYYDSDSEVIRDFPDVSEILSDFL